ncbi:DNA polymerase III subunit alpha [Kitasatospora acidiphila]|uniref:DNA-directed DNA polymerase n=1 Tax=Kitasatospora acidiphila TaxID=2567942 RepID=A0A540W4M3_9ACTN|nr:DNA polymerase III subunit alpha [Kitasatospora acidiphila]TQF03913.1 DNA polymerase III subunit alpha [Kitasatospora acidiphila]
MTFIHLHNHTMFSMLDGAARLGPLFRSAAEMGMPALAMTDHGNLHGAYAFWQEGQKHGVKPIIGLEAYVAPGSRLERSPVRWGDPSQRDDDVSGRGAYTHMTLLAESTEGMHNLFRLSSRSYAEGLYYKPRIDLEILAEHSQGIIGTTGCPGGEVQTRLRLGQYDEARAAAGRLQDILGPGNLFVELMDHGIEIEGRVRDDLLRLSRELSLPLLATNDSHYVMADQAPAHDLLLCIGTQATIDQPDRFKFSGSGYWLRSPQEMRRLWAELPEACDNTLRIAERCNVSFESQDLLPRWPVAEGWSEELWLRTEVFRGLQRRYPRGIPRDRIERAEYELSVISSMGFVSYFLVVADFIGWAKRHSIRVGPGRGSAAGSLVSYALSITDLDPIEHDLMFERFLNPERVSMPDIDIDFDDRRRGEVIEYVARRWGSERVAQIATFGVIKAKASIKDSARVLGYGYETGDAISKAYPAPIMGKDASLDCIFNPEHERYRDAGKVRAMYQRDADARTVVDAARGIEGLVRQAGVHAAGVIISAEPLIDHVPLWTNKDGGTITQFDYPTCEALGLLKMDFLGLSNLSIIDDCLREVKRNHGTDVDLLRLPLDDGRTFSLLASGQTLGVFQLDSGPMRKLLQRMRPDKFADISAVLALYRPGPMGVKAHYSYADRKNHREPIEPIHPELSAALDPILRDTYGVIVYQEQVTKAAQVVAGYSVGKADLLRKAMGKKKKEVLDAEFEPFSDGMRQNGYSEDAIRTLWDVLVPFADYAFNKAHSAAYGLISYWTAYLKAHYPAEYMAAVLTAEAGKSPDQDQTPAYLAECQRMGIQVRSPHINVSMADYTPAQGTILHGLGAIKGVGMAAGQIVAERDARGPFSSLVDLLARVGAGTLNKRVIDALLTAGALDSLGRRVDLSRQYESLSAIVSDLVKRESYGQYGLFGSGLSLLTSNATLDTGASWPHSRA